MSEHSLDLSMCGDAAGSARDGMQIIGDDNKSCRFLHIVSSFFRVLVHVLGVPCWPLPRGSADRNPIYALTLSHLLRPPSFSSYHQFMFLVVGARIQRDPRP